MCTRPITIDEETTVGCRECDECLASRTNDWVARAVAETHTAEWTGVFNLTYEQGQLGAEMFNYQDIRDWIKNIRESLADRHGVRPNLRFVVCGENGSKKGRCHWHVILWCDYNVFELGTWADFWRQWNAGYSPSYGPVKEFEVVPVPDRDHEKIWSMWPHGMVTIDQPGYVTDEGEVYSPEQVVHYVMKYAMKDQYSVRKSEGQKRVTKSENFSSSYFRMSKSPPIGDRWIDQQLAECCQKGVVPPKLKLKIDGYSYYWWPVKNQRLKLLMGLHEVNEVIKERTGRDAPQWSSLINWCERKSLLDDIWILKYGETKKQWLKGLEDEQEAKTLFKNIERRRIKKVRVEPEEIREACSTADLCNSCLWQLTDREFGTYQNWFKDQYEAYRAETSEAFRNTAGAEKWGLSLWFKDTGRKNPFCRNNT